jgi:antitoxin CptB
MTPAGGQAKLSPDIQTGFHIMGDDIEVRRRRAAWRAGHRGTKELDILVGRFAAERLAEMTAQDLDHFERFLSVTDPEIQGWILTPGADPAGEFAELVGAIRKFHGLA